MGSNDQERALMVKVRAQWGAAINTACAGTLVQPAFVGALIANETGGVTDKSRFEPAVYGHLTAVAQGLTGNYGSITKDGIGTELGETLGMKPDAYHAAVLDGSFTQTYGQALSQMTDDVVHALATSWGLTQIMGYHSIGEPWTPWDLQRPEVALAETVKMLQEFARRFKLDLQKDFGPLLHCWNTGRPDGKCFSDSYVPLGLLRMGLYA